MAKQAHMVGGKWTLNAHTVRDTACTRCNGRLPRGSRCCMFRERAITRREAAYAGTAYPTRLWCSGCVDNANKAAAEWDARRLAAEAEEAS